jgi:amino acid transporter
MATVLTLLVKIEVLADMVSIGSLFAMLMVCACVLTTRYQQPNGSITPGIPHHPRLPP